jgi:plasmid stabilization system protein ParE
MSVIKTVFTDNAKQDLADIAYFHIHIQGMPRKTALNIKIKNKSTFLLCNFPRAGKNYGK